MQEGLQQIKIDEIYWNATNKGGVPYTVKKGSNAGKPFKMVSIKTDGQYISCADFDGWTESLQQNMTATLLIEKNGEYWNFKKPTKSDELEKRVARLEEAVKTLWGERQHRPVKEEMANEPLPPEPPAPDELGLPF